MGLSDVFELGKIESGSTFNKESVITGVFKPSFPIIESKDTGVFGIAQSAEAVIKSFRSYVFGERHDTIWLSDVTFSSLLTKIKIHKNLNFEIFVLNQNN